MSWGHVTSRIYSLYILEVTLYSLYILVAISVAHTCSSAKFANRFCFNIDICLQHSPRLETKSVFRNRGSCSGISNLTSRALKMRMAQKCLLFFLQIKNLLKIEGSWWAVKSSRLVITQNGFLHKAHISIGKLLGKCQKSFQNKNTGNSSLLKLEILGNKNQAIV